VFQCVIVFTFEVKYPINWLLMTSCNDIL